MKIILKTEVSNSIKLIEDYPFEDDVVTISANVCEQMDKIAIFEVYFAKFDVVFSHADFMYDYLSIATELEDLLILLKSKKGNYKLDFYELNRSIIFTINNKYVSFEILNTRSLKNMFTVAKGDIKLKDFTFMIKSLLSDFNKVLKVYFPKAFKIFKKENFLT